MWYCCKPRQTFHATWRRLQAAVGTYDVMRSHILTACLRLRWAKATHASLPEPELTWSHGGSDFNLRTSLKHKTREATGCAKLPTTSVSHSDSMAHEKRGDQCSTQNWDAALASCTVCRMALPERNQQMSCASGSRLVRCIARKSHVACTWSEGA